ncbi:AAA family ATPase [Nitrogeniibacter mangrovi]|uniref:AAA family ATPase n=1 Tax=Nitrogeniibacter mangrovi TaxID=2016596 RepID=A0A6C1B6P1_9RHOO|nr:TniB family NTP-binding protein [Nitrogeniibacter mangrovi]QID19361.1 AAA family ATPase [Nitrogeniibacter mangrovi]
MAHFDHLDPSVHSAMLLPTEERIEFAMQDRWIGYTRAHEALDTLEDLLIHPRTHRMPNLLLVGESGNGKSTVVEKFCERHPVIQQPAGDPVLPVAIMNMPSEPVETRFWTELLLALKIAHRDSDPVQRKKNQAHSVLTYVQCRMLVIDEIHNLLYGHARQQRHFLGVLKNLSNDLRLPIVAVGTRDAIRALHTDTQLSSRFEAFGLPRWQLDKDFLRLLASFERILPLVHPSNLIERELAIKLHGMCGGTIGSLARILKRAAIHAIRDRSDKITTKTLEQIGWVKLTEYGKQAEAL